MDYKFIGNLYIFLLAITSLTYFSCNDKEDINKKEDPEVEEPIDCNPSEMYCFFCTPEDESYSWTKLECTEWKLLGYVDVETEEIIEAEPKNCDTCYTLNFVTNTRGCATGTRKSLATVNLSKKKIFNLLNTTEDILIDGDNSYLFYQATTTADTFQLADNELRILYNNRKNYLKYYKVVE